MTQKRRTRDPIRVLLARLGPPSVDLAQLLLILMSLSQTQLERAIYELKRGANVSELNDSDGYMISTERIIKEVRLASPSFCGEDATWVGWDRCKHQ